MLVSYIDMKIGSNKDISKDHRKLTVTPPEDDAPKMVKSMDKAIKDHYALQHGNPTILAKKHFFFLFFILRRYTMFIRKFTLAV